MMVRVPARAFVFGIALIMGCASEGSETPPEQRVSQPVLPGSAYSQPGSNVRFRAPVGMHVESSRFDPSSPPNKIKERFSLQRDQRLLVRVDVWTNPDDVDLDTWFDRHVAYLRLGGASIERRSVGRGKVPAIVSDTPASCQAPNVITAVFALRGQVVAVTCTNGADTEARAAFDTVLADFDVEDAL